MGIRYYAYAFDADQTRAAMADPRAVIANDLGRLPSAGARTRLRRGGAPPDEVGYVVQYLESARTFAQGLVEDGRGMAYLIG